MDEAEVRALAELARLELDAEQIPALAAHCQRMLDFVALLARLDVGGVGGVGANLHSPLALGELRPDVPTRIAATDEELRRAVLANAPAADASCFVVPRVIG
ncbi:MAG: aspartyl/glutamyl-tRNA amidotransferase subunit C [Planctomycetota bacterium]